MAPLQDLQPITAAGTYTIDPSTNLIEVNIAGPLTIVLPSAQTPFAQAQPQLFASTPVTIVDIGGNAASNNITIQPNNVAETIMAETRVLPLGGLSPIRRDCFGLRQSGP